MATPSVKERAGHVLDALALIEAKTIEMTLDSFKSDAFLRFGVERCLEIVSEVSRYLPDAAKDEHPEIPWRRVADIGNRIRHAYHAVDAEILWEILHKDLPALKAAMIDIRDRF